jgi:hypothetical protein
MLERRRSHSVYHYLGSGEALVIPRQGRTASGVSLRVICGLEFQVTGKLLNDSAVEPHCDPRKVTKRSQINAKVAYR